METLKLKSKNPEELDQPTNYKIILISIFQIKQKSLFFFLEPDHLVVPQKLIHVVPDSEENNESDEQFILPDMPESRHMSSEYC